MPTKLQGALIKLAIFAVFCLAVWGVWQMFEAKNEKIKNQGNQITQLEKDKKELKEELDKKGKSDVATVEVKTEVKKEEVKVEKAKTKANEYVEGKLKEIEAKYAKQEQTAANAERKRTEISLERAKGLWLTFCLQEPEEKACKQ